MFVIQRYNSDVEITWNNSRPEREFSYAEAYMYKSKNGDYVSFYDMVDLLEESRTRTEKEFENNLLKIKFGQ